MHGFAQPDGHFPPASDEDLNAGTNRPSATDVGGDRSNGNREFGDTELDSALQLLVERAQYITGATGTALALPQGEEMVCRASAGASAPAVGVRLQVRSGLTGESIARRQLLRCDNAETDARVNLETCRALGIASIVVLPLLRRNGEVRGLFELFSDHPYAFEERDLIALERMAELTLTALDLAEQREHSSPAPAAKREPERPAESSPTGSVRPAAVIPVHPELVEPPMLVAEPVVISSSEISSPAMSSSAMSSSAISSSAAAAPAPASVPEAMLRVQKCASCGFPVSDGRTLCLDCERKDSEKRDFATKQREKREVDVDVDTKLGPVIASPSVAPAPEEFVPAFLANAKPVEESWLSNHVNLLAIVVLILGILVAIVVFR
jgi:putative methionine-R-sulfoxide reductase with GAF domain